ncbi:ribosomal protein RSM22 (predicted rRNA methylase) [Calidifontibacter indicus]|uniref:Ribosomal protein RSM22 (Predicted rRNA methylase) n=1 Tax=Calidifontibacter indicus TaxID=419650 RepID=A0A3D9UN47_9MICO|nr:ribosomal protein RSM22 (predicted rRNA methylase) [Calidifontibacter indicus]
MRDPDGGRRASARVLAWPLGTLGRVKPLAATLRAALEDELAGRSRTELAAATARLSQRYRRGGAASAPILASDTDVAAYAAYRMPATYAACERALSLAAPCYEGGIDSVVDLGGGTGAGAWAAMSVLEPGSVQVLDQVDAALRCGKRLAPFEASFARWAVGAPVPAADLVMASFVLSELSEAQRDSLVAGAIAAARRAVFIIEPGTPDGHQRVLAARAALVQAGWTVAAPCPQSGNCPVQQPDWCHFAARVERSSVHRQIKRGDLSYEDEKFSFVFAVRDGALPAAERVLRHPGKRKGFVELTVCDNAGETGRRVVTKKVGAAYKQARDLRWGDPWGDPAARD